MQEFEGRTAVVTGAASGIGLATAKAFAELGMNVVMADIEAPRLKAAADELAAAGHDVLACETDVSKWDQIQRLADAAISRYGKVNVVHNNAGVVTAGPTEKLTLEDWEWVLGVDLWSVIYGIKAFVPLIREAGEGHVVNTASVAGLASSPAIAPYNVAKFGVVAITETLQRELEEQDAPLRASVLCPGPVDTEITNSERNRRDHEITASSKAFSETAGRMLRETGLKPSAVADLVVDAVREQKFWILPHPAWIDLLRKRVEAMEDRRLA